MWRGWTLPGFPGSCCIPSQRASSLELARRLLYSQLRDGKRNQGRPKLRFKDIVKRNLKQKNILVDSWRQQAKERTTRTNLIKA